jgi:hypothetical protein
VNSGALCPPSSPETNPVVPLTSPSVWIYGTITSEIHTHARPPWLFCPRLLCHAHVSEATAVDHIRAILGQPARPSRVCQFDAEAGPSTLLSWPTPSAFFAAPCLVLTAPHVVEEDCRRFHGCVLWSDMEGVGTREVT